MEHTLASDVNTCFRILGRIAVHMRPIATDVAWSVCLSNALVSPAKTAEPIGAPFGVYRPADVQLRSSDQRHDT